MQPNGPDFEQLPLLSETPTARPSCESDGPECPSTATFGTFFPTPDARDAQPEGLEAGKRRMAKYSTCGLQTHVAVFNSSPVGSLANLTRLQESVALLVMSVTCGPSSPASSESSRQGGLWPRTSQDSSPPSAATSSGESSRTWPKWGIARDGGYGELLTWAPSTAGSGSSSWPTPRAEERSQYNSQDNGMALSRAVKWPTPTSRDHKDGSAAACKNVPVNCLLGRAVHFPTPHANCHTGPGQAPQKQGGENLQTVAGGSLNPTWVEWLMGFPLGWTALEPSETPSSRSKRTRSSKP